MSTNCSIRTVSHDGQMNKIVLFPGISIEELTSLMQSLFSIDATPIGFLGQVCIHSEITLMTYSIHPL
jgi:hypothetical protein